MSTISEQSFSSSLSPEKWDLGAPGHIFPPPSFLCWLVFGLYIQRLTFRNVIPLNARVHNLGHTVTSQVKIMPIPQTDTCGADYPFVELAWFSLIFPRFTLNQTLYTLNLSKALFHADCISTSAPRRLLSNRTISLVTLTRHHLVETRSRKCSHASVGVPNYNLPL